MRRIRATGGPPRTIHSGTPTSQRTPVRGTRERSPIESMNSISRRSTRISLDVTVQQPLDLPIEFRRPVQVQRPAQLDDRRQATRAGGELELVRHGLSSLTEQQSRRSRLLP